MNKARMFSESTSRIISESTATTSCGGIELEACRDDSAAKILKMIAICSILAAGIAGIALPLVGKKRRFLQTDGNLFVAAKAFAAGVILATGFVHMLPDGSEALSDPCLPTFPWSKFPFAGFFAMIASLVTLLVDSLGTQFYERKQENARVKDDPSLDGSLDISGSGIVVMDQNGMKDSKGKVFEDEETGGMHNVGIHAQGSYHKHAHPDGHQVCDGHLLADSQEHSHGHSHGFGGDAEGGARHAVISQVLELGIVSHSIIIGLSLGVSQSPCTIRPLIAALSFHQFFEGFALGGCISQAQFKTLSTALMACFFAITTPTGVAIGVGISSFYNSQSPRALVIEGVLDSISAGILVYMALVDLIAADFLSKRMSCNVRLQVVSYLMLFLGAGLMSSLAIWS